MLALNGGEDLLGDLEAGFIGGKVVVEGEIVEGDGYLLGAEGEDGEDEEKDEAIHELVI
jgi:hypothetical protein